MLELEHGFRAVDVHARLGVDPGTPPDGPRLDAEALERHLHQAGIVKAAVFAHATGADGYLRANNAVARHAIDRPFVALARLDGPRDPATSVGSRLRNRLSDRADHHAAPDDVERYAYGDRFRGFRLDPHIDGLPDAATLDAVADAELPVFAHGGRGFTPEMAAESLLERGVTVVQSHFGGHPLDRSGMDDALALLDEYDHYYLDTSAVRYRDLLERALREHPDRVLFGSGAPDVHPNVAVMELLTLDVPEDAMARAFDANPRRVLPALGAQDS
ncbi:amidohydrolase family protein [Halarchaeum sp. P4]|uniref:amidohydrolase family protein n=1 Tax=Halarchaeum sp. P4 TaxID=3421639 RepID=UPI003EBBCA09